MKIIAWGKKIKGSLLQQRYITTQDQAPVRGPIQWLESPAMGRTFYINNKTLK